MRRRRRGFTLVELLVIIGIIAIFISMVDVGICKLLLWLLLPTAWFGAFAVFAAVRRMRIACLCSIGIVLACVIASTPSMLTMFPMHFAQLNEAHYKNADLATVLMEVSAQKQNSPYWRFELPKELAHSRVSVEISQACTLRKGMDLVADASDCEYEWYWHSMCGGRPICAVFRFYRRDAKDGDYLIVDRHGILGE